MIVVHICDMVATKRVKVCDGTPLIEVVPSGDTTNKILCEKCRETFRNRKR